ncbi:DUF6875 domain-containing protein [Nocardia carnea]|uniref:DUF6875 domain-containing protein n=1 Tax=Nocardia carnea TaxID=37328 RepID=UPI002457B988|nr:hypothetical protein [Nocardia carnea]
MSGRRAIDPPAARRHPHPAPGDTATPPYRGPRSGSAWHDVYDDAARWTAEHPDAAVLVRWIADYLGRPHPELGRAGPVCPFVRQTADHHALWAAVVRGGDDLTAEQISATVLDAHELYNRLRAGDSDNRRLTTVTVFPGLTRHDRIDAVHRRHKTAVVHDGLMLGQFYPGCRVPGLWNAEFRPLDAPLPMLVIRPMMTTDYPFLVARTDWLYAYFGKVAPQLPRALRWSIAERMRVPEAEAGAITALRVHDGDEHAR